MPKTDANVNKKLGHGWKYRATHFCNMQWLGWPSKNTPLPMFHHNEFGRSTLKGKKKEKFINHNNAICTIG